jgi:hypothetical protein
VPSETADYVLTIERLRPSAPDATILICLKPDRSALDMLITLKRSIRAPNASAGLSGAALGILFDVPYYLVSLQPASSVYTQEHLDREAVEFNGQLEKTC